MSDFIWTGGSGSFSDPDQWWDINSGDITTGVSSPSSGDEVNFGVFSQGDTTYGSTTGVIDGAGSAESGQAAGADGGTFSFDGDLNIGAFGFANDDTIDIIGGDFDVSSQWQNIGGVLNVSSGVLSADTILSDDQSSITVSGGVLSATDLLRNEGAFTANGGAVDAAVLENDTSMAIAGGSVSVSGSLTNYGNLTITDGNINTATLVSDGALSISGGSVEVTVSLATVSSSTIAVSGDGSLAVVNALVLVPGTKLSVTAGGSVTSESGDVSTSPFQAKVDGAGSKWTVSDTLQVGNTGGGQLVITGGGSVAAGSLIVATGSAVVGEVSMAGAGSGLSVAGTLTVGDAGLGTLDITSGATATAIALIEAAQSTSGTATRPDMVTVDGAGSKLTISNSATVDTAMPTATNGNGDPDGTDGVWSYTNSGFGQIEVSNGGYISIGQTLTLQAPVDPALPALLTIESGGGVEVGGNGGLTANTLQVDANGLIIGHGQITGTVTGDVPVSDSTTAPTYSLNIDNDGKIEASNGLLVLDGNLSGDGQVLVGQDSTLEFGGTVADNATAMFLPGADGTITIDDPADFQGVISSENFEPGDAIDLPNVPYIDPGSADLNPDGASFYFETGEQQQNYVLQVVVNDQTYNIPINEDAPLSGGFTLSDDGHGGTLITYTADAVTDYSDTAIADGNVQSYHSGVVRVLAPEVDTSQTSSGSGFVVASGPTGTLILTAAHVVPLGTEIAITYPSGNGWIVKRGVVEAENPITGLLGHIGFAAANLQYDWAYLYVPGANFPLSAQFTIDKSFSIGTVNVTGYPGNAPQPTQYTDTVYDAESVFGSVITLLGVDPKMSHGASGGPVWIYNGTTAQAVGIYTQSFPTPLALSLFSVPSPPALFPTFFTDPPSNASRITSAVVVDTGDADAGQTVRFFVNMSENVMVAGAGPTLALSDGGAATYNAADSTGTELIFDYTVSAGDQTSNLEITQVNGVQTVQAPGGASIDFSVLDNQATDLSINSPLVVTSVDSSQTGEVSAGQLVQLTLTMSSAVTVNLAGGAPTLTLNDNATATYDTAASNPSAGTLVFDYTVGSGDETANLEVTSVNLPSGTAVQDAAGYNADFSAAINVPTGLQVGPAYIPAITPSLTIDVATGQTLQVTLAISQGVTVDTTGGSPTLSLSDGATATYDAAASNPSAGNLVFDYTVGSGDYTTDLQILGYNPNGATVTDAHGVNANLSGATQYDLALDVNAATVTNLAAFPSSGEADIGQTVTLTLTMSEPITVNLAGGSPTLSLNDGATATYDGAASNSSAGTLVFAYTVGTSDETPSLQISQVNLNGATIDDAHGNAADLSAAANFTTNLQIGPAFVTSLTPSLTGEIFTEQTDQLTLAMSQGVTVDTTSGSPTLSLSDGATATYDSASSDPSTGTLVFDYTVGADDYTTDLTVLDYDPNGATVTDASGVNADFSSVGQSDLDLDVNAATITAVTASPSSGEADSGAPVTVTLTMSEAVTVNTTNGAPTLSLSSGATATYDSAASNPSAGTLVFDDTVGAADETPDLQVIQVNLNGATIDDANGNAADLSAASSFDTGLQIGPVFVDSVTPSLSGDITAGQTVQLTASMSAGLTVNTTDGSPTLSLSDGATATYDTAASAPSAGTLVFDYTVGAGDYATDLSVVGLIANGATFTDANGVSPDFSGLAQSYLGLDVNAATVTNVTASTSSGSPSSGEALSGQQVLLTLAMNEPVTVNMTGGSPTLDLSDGAVATYDSAASNPAANALVFSYTVGATDEDPNLQIAQVDLNGATIDGANGKAADLSAAATIATNLQIGAASAMPCFLAGTRIATPCGEIPVEALAIGDLVQAQDAGIAPVKWIGHRRVNCRNHPKPRKVWPVRVRAGAFGDGVPHRDLWLSPDHAVFVDDVLIPIKRLINGTSIEQVPMDEVTYYHIELEHHDVLLAEGLPAESYLDVGDRFNFANGRGPIALHPEFSTRKCDTALIWAALGCARLIVAGPELETVRALVGRFAKTQAAA